MLGRTDSGGRLLLLLATFVVVAISLVARLTYWQVVRRDDLAEQARLQTSLRIATPSRRGTIYDRSGVVALASSVERARIVAAPDQLSDSRARTVGAELAGILGLDAEATTALIAKLREDRPYVVLARDIEPEAAERIRAASLAGRLPQISLEPEPARVHPQAGGGPDSTLAAHLLGFVNREGVGQYGIEQQYDDILAGTPRVVLAQKDINSRPIPESSVVSDPGTPGTDVRLTIDAGLQLALEQEILAAWVADQAVSVSAVVMNPATGEIYAEATWPSYDADDYRQIATADPARFVDPVVSRVYEPGSVFKMLTVVAAFESGKVGPKTRVKDVGTLRLDGGRTKIDDADRRGMGWMTFEDAIAYSRNVVAAKVALGLDTTTTGAATRLHEVWTRLGFGAPTGIDLAGEVAGIVRDPTVAAWRQVDLANAAFGQGVAVTPIQLAAAYSAMVNGGRLVQPHVVASVGQLAAAPGSGSQVLAPSLSPTLVEMMRHVVTEVPFYRDRTLIRGYDVGGKTGTAQIWDSAAGTWKRNLFNYSFIGYVGRQEGRPEVVVAVRIEEARPTVVKVGRLEMPVMSFELFRRIANDAITTPGLLPARPPSGPASPAPVTADR